jgi:hypothetical protein
MKKLQNIILLFFMLFLLQRVSAQTTATKSDDFVEGIGVNTHFHYNGTPYVDNFSTIKSLLGGLGIRYFRDNPDDDVAYANRIKDVCNTYGMKLECILPTWYMETGSGYNPAGVAANIDWLKNNIGPQYFLNMEGLNEPDIWDDNAPNYGTMARDVQQALYNKMKSDAAWNNVKVLGPSGAFGNSYADMGDMRSMTDKGNMHWYPSGSFPANLEFNDFNWHLSQARTYNYSDGRPIILTETGYTNAGGTQACGENAAAKYIPRMHMWMHYTKGIEKVFTYEFVNQFNGTADPEDNWGLVRHNLTVKPAYNSLKNTITLLKEPGANFTPGQLNYSLSGDMTNVYQKLFQKSNGTYYLVVWQEVKSYDVQTKKDIVVPNRALTLNLGSTSTVKTYLPLNSTNAVNTYTNSTSVGISVPDHLLIIAITPGGSSTTGSLSGSVAINTTAVNLTTTGTGDWKHFSNNSHRASGGRINSISNYSVIGGTAASYTDDLRNMSWTGGTPTASSTNNKNGWYKAGVGNGFSFTAAAGNGTNTLKVYVGGWNSGGTLTAHLSNSAAPDYVNTVGNTNGQWDAAYTITYNAAQAGQTLTITWKQASGTGNVTIQAAALVGTVAARVATTADAQALSEETSNESGLVVYPNPAENGKVSIKINGESDAALVIHDMSGRPVYNGQVLHGQVLELDQVLKPGLYLFKVSNGKWSDTRKVIVK